MWWREVSESEKAAEVIRVKAEEQNIMCLLHRELNPSMCVDLLKSVMFMMLKQLLRNDDF